MLSESDTYLFWFLLKKKITTVYQYLNHGMNLQNIRRIPTFGEHRTTYQVRHIEPDWLIFVPESPCTQMNTILVISVLILTFSHSKIILVSKVHITCMHWFKTKMHLRFAHVPQVINNHKETNFIRHIHRYTLIHNLVIYLFYYLSASKLTFVSDAWKFASSVASARSCIKSWKPYHWHENTSIMV